MNILIMTSGLLLILSIIGFAQLEKFHKNYLFDLVANAQFLSTQEKLSLELREIAHSQYDKILSKKRPVKSKQDDKNSDKHSDKNSRGRRSSFLSIASLIKEDESDEEIKKQEVTKLLLEKLLTALYGKEPFFVEAKNSVPDLEKALILTIIKKAQEAKKEHKLKKAKDLANLDLEDESLKSILYKILKGSKDWGQKVEDQEDNYYSLLNYINIDKKKACTSVYLAPKALLFAIFQDEAVVEDICSERENIYYEISKDDTKIDSLGEEFKNKFKGALPSYLDSHLIDFDISTTNPKDYTY